MNERDFRAVETRGPRSRPMDSRIEQLQRDKQAVGQVASKDKEVINCVCMKQNFSFRELNRGLGGNRKKKNHFQSTKSGIMRKKTSLRHAGDSTSVANRTIWPKS